MNWKTSRFARLLGVPRQQGAHRGPVVPEPRSSSDRPVTAAPTLPRLTDGLSGSSNGSHLSAPVKTATVLVAARDDDVRFLLRRRCEMSEHLEVVGDAQGPVGALRAVHRLRPDIVVVQMRSTTESDVEVITAFKELSPSTKVFAYSSLPGGAAVSAAMTAGADRYGLAGAPLATLMREIEDLAAPAGARTSPRT